MKRHIIFCLVFFPVFCLVWNSSHAQTINPNVDAEVCPNLSYPNGAGYPYTLTFADAANQYSIGAMNRCKVEFYTVASNNPKVATVFIQFEDQSANAPSFEIKKGSALQSTFTFTHVKSIADRTLENVLPSVTVPLCSSIGFQVSFTSMKYKTSTGANYGSNLPFYEYELPAGYTMTAGNLGTGSAPGLVRGTNNVSITPPPFGGGLIKVRAENANCNGGLSKASLWSNISISRPQLSLQVDGAQSLTVSCGTTAPKTFTLVNAPSCITSYIWNIGTSNGWLYNGLPAQPTITTTSNTITLTPTCNSALSSISVVPYINSTAYPAYPIPVLISRPASFVTDGSSTPGTLCSVKKYYVTNIPCGTAVQWTVSPANIASLAPDPSDPTNSSKIQVTKVAATGNISLIAHYVACGEPQAKGIGIKVGAYSNTDFPIYGASQLCPYSSSMYTTQYFPEVTYNWMYTGNVTIISGPPNSFFCSYLPGGDGYANLILYANNACSSGPPTIKTITINPLCYLRTGKAAIHTITPNPASSQITITTNNFSNKQFSQEVTEVKIYDLYGRLQLRKRLALTNSTTMPLDNLKKGIYLIEIGVGADAERQKLLVQ